VDLAILEAVVGRRGPRAAAAGGAWVPVGSVVADLAVVAADGAAGDFTAVAEVLDDRCSQENIARQDNAGFWRFGYVAPGSESQT